MFVLQDLKAALRHLAFSPDGASLIACGERGGVQVWDLASRRIRLRLHTGDGSNERAYLIPGAAEFVVLQHGWLRAYDLGTGVCEGARPRRSTAFVKQAAVDPGQGRAAVSFWATLMQYRLPGWEKVARKDYGQDTAGRPAPALAYSPDGRALGLGTDFGRVVVYDADTLKRAALIDKVHSTDAVVGLAIAPAARSVAWGAGPNLCLWHLAPLQEVAHHRLGRTHVLSVAFHPSGEFFATANGDGKVDFWDTRTGERRESFDWGTGKLNHVAFDATGDRAACCGKSGQIVVWDVDR